MDSGRIQAWMPHGQQHFGERVNLVRAGFGGLLCASLGLERLVSLSFPGLCLPWLCQAFTGWRFFKPGATSPVVTRKET